jgi:hypothetical protein
MAGGSSRVTINIAAKDNASKAFQKVADEMRKLEKEAESATGRLEAVGSKFRDVGESMMKVGGFMTAGVTLPIVAGFKAAADAARESQKIVAVTEQVIKSTGGAAKITAEQVDDLATSLSNKTAIDDEVILKGQQVMLTFTKIRNEAGKGNDIFNRASAAMLDLGTVFGSTDAAAMQLGKALNDPLKGIGALSRAGVSFTQQQKDQIATLVQAGDVLGAQKIILAEVEGQVGGTAAASATSYDRMRVAVGNLQESFGSLLLPVIEKVSTFIADLAAKFDTLSPAAQKMIVIGALIAAAIGPVVTIVGGLVTAIGFLLSPIGLVIVAIAALVAGFIYAYRNFEGFREAVNKIASVIRDVAVKAFQMLREGLVTAVNIMSQAWARWGDDVKAAFDMIMAIIRPAFEMIKSIITAVMRAIKGDWSGAWEALKQAASKGVEMIVAAAKLLGELLKGAMKLAWELAQKAFDAGKDLVVEAAKKLPGLILQALGKLGDLLLEAGKDIVRGLAKGISGAIDLVKDAASSLAKKLPGWVKSVLGIKSPSTVFAEIGVDIVRGLAVGIDEEQDTALRAVNDLADKIVSAFTASIDAVRGAYGAFKSTRGATEQAAAAQEALNELRVKASTIDQRLVDAERRLADAKAKGEDGASDLRDAEADLAELRREKLSLPKEMTDATRQLADAQDSLTDATLAQFEAARKLADQGPRALEVFAAYASQAGVAAAEIDKITSAARSLAASIDGIPSMKTVAVTLVQGTQTPPQYDPGSAIATSDAGINSGRRVENGVEYVWVEGIGWVRKSGGQVQTGARASGGPVMAGGAYVVGENGPELFRPSRSGTIVPGGGTTIVVNVAGSILSERDLTAAVVDGLRRSGAVRPDGSVRVAR